MKRKVLCIITVCLIGIVIFGILIFGGPIIINELYKENTGYITLWGAKEVLGYYGIILGCLLNALVSIYVVRKTIRNTRSQILYEKEVENEKVKWKKVEQIIDDTLKLLEPAQYILVNIDIYQPEKVYFACDSLLANTVKMKTSVDWIKAYVRPDEYGCIKPLVDLIIPVINQECGLCEELRGKFMQMLSDSLNFRLNTAMEKDVDVKDWDEKQKIYLENIKLIKEKFTYLQQNEYQNLLNCRRDVFIHIYGEISKRKQFILEEI